MAVLSTTISRLIHCESAPADFDYEGSPLGTVSEKKLRTLSHASNFFSSAKAADLVNLRGERLDFSAAS
jgi:hypothetical protein